MTLSINFRSAKLKKHSRLLVDGSKKGTVQLIVPETGKTFATAKVKDTAALTKAWGHMISGQISELIVSSNKQETAYKAVIAPMHKWDWSCIAIGEYGDIIFVGNDLDDEPDASSPGTQPMPMMDPVSAGVAIVAIITLGAVAWHAIDEGATLKVKANSSGLEVEVDANGPDELPDNGDNPQLPGD